MNTLDYRTIQDYNGLYQTIPDYTGLYQTILDYTRLNMTIHDYTRLYWNILVYSSKECKDFKKSVTLRQTDTQTLRHSDRQTE